MHVHVVSIYVHVSGKGSVNHKGTLPRKAVFTQGSGHGDAALFLWHPGTSRENSRYYEEWIF